MVKVSVVIPVFNGEKYIEECVKSIQSQTLNEIEIILVDDGSNDKTTSIIKKLQELDKRIILIMQENKGVLSARGNGYNKAKGKYILSIDSDDWIEKDCCEIMYKKMVEENLDMVICDFYEEYKHFTKKQSGGQFNNVIKNDEYIRLYLIGKISSYLWTRMFKKDIVKNINFNEPISFGDDTYINICSLHKIKNISKVNKNLVHYRIREGSLTKKYDKSIYEIWKIVNHIDSNFSVQFKNNYRKELDIFIYNHVFRSRLLDRRNIDSHIHESMYKEYKKRKIRIWENEYFKKNVSNKHKIMTYSYKINYTFGKVATVLINKVVFYTRVKNRLDYYD